jgi:hypothetical protein
MDCDRFGLRLSAALVESKDFTDFLVSVEPIAKLHNQLLRRPSNALGLIGR